MNAEDFLEIIKSCKHGHEWPEFASELCGSSCWVPNYSDLNKELLSLDIKIKSEDGYGGEGQGDEYWGVFSVTNFLGTTYFKISGWYASYSGSEIEAYNLEAVEKVPVQTYEWKKK